MTDFESALLRKLDLLSDRIARLEAERQVQYIGLPQAAALLGVGRTTMTKRLQEGYYPFAFKVNGQWRFDYNEIRRAAAAAR